MPEPIDLRSSAPGDDAAVATTGHDALLGVLVAEAPLGIVVLDRDGRYLMVNERIADLDGVPVADHLGRTVGELVPDLDEAATYVLHHVLHRGELLVEGTLEVQVPAHPGRRVALQGTWYPVHGSEGSAVAVAGIITDVTEQRRADRREGYLAATAAALVRTRTRADAVRVVLEPLIELLGARGAALSVPDGEAALAPIAVVGYEQHPSDEPAPPVPLGSDLPLIRAFRSGQAVHHAGRDELSPDARRLAERLGDHAGSAVPLIVDGRTLGVIAISFDRPTELDRRDRELLGTVANLAAGALRRAEQFEQVRDQSLALQHALLPAELPHLDGYELCGRYRPAAATAAVGGDWYDAFSVRSGDRMVLSVGDVAGHGIRSAAVMGRLRNRLMGLAHVDPRPGAVLAGLDALTRSDGTFATALVAVLDPARGSLRLASAGHPPPLLHHRGRSRWVTGPVGPPIGTGGDGPPATRRAGLEPGDTLVMVTDGLYEDRRVDVDASLEALRSAADGTLGSNEPLDVACDALVEAALRERDQTDDVCLLALRRTR